MDTSFAIPLGPVTFPSKSAAEKHLREILQTEHGRLTGQNALVVRALLDRHPNRSDKIGCGLAHIEVAPNPRWSGRQPCFWAVRTDDTRESFTYKLVGPSSVSSEHDDLMRALRHEIQSDIDEFRHRAFTGGKQPRCALSGVELRNDHTTQVDHVGYEFADMARAFISRWGRKTSSIPLHRDADGRMRLTEVDQLDWWLTEHGAWATLQLVHADAHALKSRARQQRAA